MTTPILGDITAFTIATPSLETSCRFYEQLGFGEVFRADWPFPWVQITDGAILIMLRLAPDPYMALTYYVKNINEVIADLDHKGIVFSEKPKPGDPVARFVFESPDGLIISLVSIIEGFSRPPGPTMLTMAQSDFFKPETYANKVCGMYGEYAHPVADLERSLAYWQLLGFAAVSRFASPYPWAIISDGLSIVGLHQTTDFSRPAITYFAADMKQKLSHLQDAGLTGYTEKGAGNATLKTPEGQYINLFSIGM